MPDFNDEIFQRYLSGEMDEIVFDPEKFNAPTFEQFRRNRDKYIGNKYEQFEYMTAYAKPKGTKEVKHVFMGTTFANEDRLISAVEAWGFDPAQMRCVPKKERARNGGDSYILHWFTKDEYERRFKGI